MSPTVSKNIRLISKNGEADIAHFQKFYGPAKFLEDRQNYYIQISQSENSFYYHPDHQLQGKFKQL
jgi:hypothetical protein